MGVSECWISWRKWHKDRPKRICWCIPLRKGIIALAYFNLFFAIAAYGYFILIDYHKTFEDFIRHGSGIMFRYSSEYQLLLVKTYSYTHVHILTYIGAALSELVCTVLLMVGLHRKDLELTKIYLFYSVSCTGTVVMLRCLNLRHWDIDLGLFLFDLLGLLTYTIFRIYFIRHVNNQMIRLENTTNGIELQVVTTEAVTEKCDQVGVHMKRANEDIDHTLSSKHYPSADFNGKLVNNKHKIQNQQTALKKKPGTEDMDEDIFDGHYLSLDEFVRIKDHESEKQSHEPTRVANGIDLSENNEHIDKPFFDKHYINLDSVDMSLKHHKKEKQDDTENMFGMHKEQFIPVNDTSVLIDNEEGNFE